jgi:ATP-dependent RNA helicase DeaD
MHTFSLKGIHPSLLKVLADQGITEPTEIQEEVVPVLLKHDGDLVARSATGTGKTYAFGIPLLSRVNPAKGIVQGVVLVPTRELSEQVGSELIKLGAEIEGLSIAAIYGGVSMKAQTKAISNGAQIIVATPGRLMDLVKRDLVDLKRLEFVVFDEADEMLLKGFGMDVDRILDGAQDANYKTWLFSATMPYDINSMIKKYMKKDLKRVLLGSRNDANEGIIHQAVVVNEKEKQNVLLHTLTRWEGKKGIIFCRTKSGVNKLYKQLASHKIKSGALHGDLPQGLRTKMLDQYREGTLGLLVATDVAARGLDITDVEFVIQYHLPDVSTTYTHRSGRTSRIGNAGTCLTLLFKEDEALMRDFSKEIDFDLEWLDVPSEKDQLINNAIVWAGKIAQEKPVHEAVSDADKKSFNDRLAHLSREALMEKLLAGFLREQQG